KAKYSKYIDMEPESFANSQPASRNIANPQSVREIVNLASMDEPQSLVLRAWEAVSRERHLQGVLEAVTEVLLPHVPFFSIGIIALEGERHDLYALHVVGVPHREGETMREFLRRREPDNPPPLQVPSRPLIPYPDMTGKTGKPGAGWPPARAGERGRAGYETSDCADAANRQEEDFRTGLRDHASKIRTRNGAAARRRRRRREVDGQLSAVRPEKAGGEICGDSRGRMKV